MNYEPNANNLMQEKAWEKDQGATSDDTPPTVLIPRRCLWMGNVITTPQACLLTILGFAPRELTWLSLCLASLTMLPFPCGSPGGVRDAYAFANTSR